jgi:hypothetical protein
MIKTAAVPSLLITLVTFASGSTAIAQTPAPKPTAASPAAAPKPAAAPVAPPKPTAAPVAPPKPTAAPVAPPKPAAAPVAPPKPAAAPAAAAVPAAPAMPTPSKELEAFMKGFEGSWSCDTKFPAGSMGPGSPEMSMKSSVKIRKDYGGFSWHGEFKLAKTKAMPAMSGVFQVGYETGTKQATFLSYDSMGSAMMGVGPISGDSVTFTEEGYMMGMKAKMRETMTKKGPKEIHHSVEADQGKGFQLMAEDTCKK